MPTQENTLPSGVARGPWRCRSTRLVYENPWIRLHHDEVTTPAGTAGIYGRIHFRNVAIGIIPVDTDNHTWLVRQHRYVLGEDSWEIPEGGSPEGENPLDTAKRELEEETGLKANDWELLMRLHTSNSVTDEEALIYIARDLSTGQMALEATEDIVARRVPLTEAVRMVLEGRITDSLSVAGLLKAAWVLGLEV
ncbi:MAG: NUDIX hydrolase [Gammaproteobacteria bacterium]|nr:MAG: NUDIX hydrolase [Gammaproteobacteria bacterium]